MIAGYYIWFVITMICVMPAVVFWGISCDGKTYENLDDPVPMRIIFFVFAIAFTTPMVISWIKSSNAFFVRRVSDLFTADADGFVPVSELATAMGIPEYKLVDKITFYMRKGYIINCNYSAAQKAFLLSDKIGAPTSMYQGAPVNQPFIGVHCPGCGASLKIRANTQGTCPYCGRLIIAPSFDPNTNKFG